MPITTEIDDGGIAEVVVDHPPVNALPVAGWFELAAALRGLGEDPGVRVVVLRAEGGPVTLGSGGIPIGLFPQSRYARGSLALKSGDVLLACTDGITEADNPAGDQFESERMVGIAQVHRQGAAQKIVDTVCAEVTEFHRGGIHHDDRVMLAIKVL